MADVEGSSPNSEAFLTRSEASDYLRERYKINHSEGYLTNLACRGTGPTMVYHSRFPRYSTADLDEYARSKIGPRVRSASEGRAARLAA